MKQFIGIDPARQVQIDQLVAGELSESERLELLAWLDEDVRRWRVCGLAFLEVDLWAGALSMMASERGPMRMGESQLELPRAKSRFERILSSRVALAIAVVAAFVGGMGLTRYLPLSANRPQPQNVEQSAPLQQFAAEHVTHQPLFATIPVSANTVPRVPLMLQMPIKPETVDEPEIGSASLSEYERMQWAKRGFEVVEEQRYLPVYLPDGRSVVVPVNKVQLKFKWTPVS
jgi:hypothetical protein